MRWKFKCVLKLRALTHSLQLCSLAAVHPLQLPTGSSLHTHYPACPLPEAVGPPGAGGAPDRASLPRGLESAPSCL